MFKFYVIGMLDMLIIDDNDIANILIDMNGIEQLMIVQKVLSNMIFYTSNTQYFYLIFLLWLSYFDNIFCNGFNNLALFNILF